MKALFLIALLFLAALAVSEPGLMVPEDSIEWTAFFRSEAFLNYVSTKVKKTPIVTQTVTPTATFTATATAQPTGTNTPEPEPTATRTPVIGDLGEPVGICPGVQLKRQEAAAMALSVCFPLAFVAFRRKENG